MILLTSSVNISPTGKARTKDVASDQFLNVTTKGHFSVDFSVGFRSAGCFLSKAMVLYAQRLCALLGVPERSQRGDHDTVAGMCERGRGTENDSAN